MALIRGESSNPNEPAVHGKSTAPDQGMGVMGEATRGSGVIGISTEWIGVYGESAGFEGVRGTSKNNNHAGVVGTNEAGGFGVYGEGTNGTGVFGKSKGWHAVGGISESAAGGAGVYGEAVDSGVIGMSKTWHGVYGETPSTTGGAGIWGEHKGAGNGVVGVSSGGVGVYGKGGRVAGLFEGDVEVTGDIRLVNADCAEDFDIVGVETVEPGTVMVLENDGCLKPSDHAYDKRVAGVISGAGNYKPGIVLDKQATQGNRSPVALLGKVFCKVDANYGSIEVGDLLTTSDTPGHAMKAEDSGKAFGSVIGKALRPLFNGQGLIPVLIALQ